MLTVSSFVLLLLVMAVQQTRSAAQLRQERNRAITEAARAQEIVVFLRDLFASANPGTSAGDLTVRDLLNLGSRNIHGGLADQPEVKLDLMQVIGASLRGIGDLNGARSLLAEASQQIIAKYGEESLEYATVGRQMALLELEAGAPDKAKTIYQRIWPVLQEKLPKFDPRRLEVLQEQAFIQSAMGDHDSARRFLADAEALLPKVPDVSERQRGRFHLFAAEAAANRENKAEALKHGRLALKLLTRSMGKNHPLVGDALKITGIYEPNLQEAELLLNRAVALFRENLGDKHLKLAAAMDGLASLYATDHRHEQAYQLHQQVYEIQHSQLEEDSIGLAYVRINLAGAALHLNRLEEAEALLLSAQRVLRLKLPVDHYTHSTYQELLGFTHLRQGKPEHALSCFTAAMMQRERVLGASHPQVMDLWIHRAEALAVSKQWAQAEEEYRRGIQGLLASANPPKHALTHGQFMLGSFLLRRNRPMEALPFLDQAYAERALLEINEQLLLLNHLAAVIKQGGDQSRLPALIGQRQLLSDERKAANE